MKPRTSQRKKRAQRRLSPEQAAMIEVRDLTLPACVARVEDEVQGEFNILCVFVYLDAAASAPDIAEIETIFGRCLERVLPPASTPIDWSVSLWKGEEIVGSVDSRDY